MQTLPIPAWMIRGEVEVGLLLHMVEKGALVRPVRPVLARQVGHRCVLRKQFVVRGAEPAEAIYHTRLALNLLSI